MHDRAGELEKTGYSAFSIKVRRLLKQDKGLNKILILL